MAAISGSVCVISWVGGGGCGFVLYLQAVGQDVIRVGEVYVLIVISTLCTVLIWDNCCGRERFCSVLSVSL